MTETVNTVNMPAEAEATAAKASPAKNEQTKPTETPAESEQVAEKNPTVRVSKNSSLRKLIGFCIKKVESDEVVTIQALNLCVHKAIILASIVRDRVGNVSQINSLLVLDNERLPGKTTSGIQIVLSLGDLDNEDVGYQKPKPQGYAASRLNQSK